MDRNRARWEAGVGAAAIAIAAAFLHDGRTLPPGVFEPIGPGPVPRAVCLAIIALALAMMAPPLWHLATGRTTAPDAPPFVPRPAAAALVLAGTAVYVAAMGLGWIGFAPATIVFLTITIWFLAEFRPAVLPVAVGLAVVLGFGLRHLFTRVLVTDLP